MVEPSTPTNAGNPTRRTAETTAAPTIVMASSNGTQQQEVRPQTMPDPAPAFERGDATTWHRWSAMLRRLPACCLLALVAGSTLLLAFAPWSLWMLAPLPPAIAFRLAHGKRPREAFAIGYAFGVGLFGVGVAWIHISLARFSDSGMAVAVLATTALVALLAIFPAVALATARWLHPRVTARALLLVTPAVWVLLEWVRTWLLSGFPWLLLGYSQVESPVARAVGPVFGVLGTSAVVAFFAAVLAWSTTAFKWRRLVLVPVGVVVASFAIVGVAEIRWTRAAGPAMTVGLVQGNITQDRKWRAKMAAETLKRYRDLTAPLWGVDLVVWPETALPLWYDSVPADYRASLESKVATSGTSLILGVPTRTNGRGYNSAISVGEGATYHKRHLVPFGEYIPFRAVLGRAVDLLGAPMSNFSAGTQPVLLPAGPALAAVAICYEIAFGAEVADVGAKAGVLVNISNDAWFGDSLGPRQHLEIARMRAVELERYLLRATNTGLTTVVDPEGRVVASMAPFEAGTLRSVVRPRTGTTPYGRWEDLPLLAALALVLGPFCAFRVTTAARRRRHSIRS